MQKKYVYNDITYKYLQKVEYQRNKLKILRKGGIKNYKAFKNSYTNENNGIIVIDTSSEENIPYSRMNQGDNKEFIKLAKSKKYSDWSDKNLQTYEGEAKIEDKIGIISMFENGKK